MLPYVNRHLFEPAIQFEEDDGQPAVLQAEDTVKRGEPEIPLEERNDRRAGRVSD